MTGANVARAMQLSAPTVHEMIGRLERDGYITRGSRQARCAFTDYGREHAERHRPPPPADRALPHRRARDPVGRGARGGRAARARDVAGARGAHARRHRRRQDLPARPSDRRRRAASRACRSPTCEPGATIRILRFENEAEDLLHYLKDSRHRAGPRGHVVAPGDDEVTVELGGTRDHAHALGGRDGLGGRRPVAAAAHRAARAARALQGPLRPLRPKLTPDLGAAAAGARDRRVHLSGARSRRGPCRGRGCRSAPPSARPSSVTVTRRLPPRRGAASATGPLGHPDVGMQSPRWSSAVARHEHDVGEPGRGQLQRPSSAPLGSRRAVRRWPASAAARRLVSGRSASGPDRR